MIHCGDSFLIPAPRTSLAIPHLWVVVTEPNEAFECVIVSLTTLRRNADQTVVLRKGDHPFIRHDTTVFYADSRIVDARRLAADVTGGTAETREPCSAAILRELQSGVLASPYTANKIVAFCKKCWGKG